MIRRWLRILCAGAAIALLQGCTPSSGPPPRAAVSAVYYYGPSPFYYDRRVVYYDVSGRPIYFVTGVWHRVPVHYRHYDVMVRDYHRHRDTYRRYHYERRGPSHRLQRASRERPPRRAH
jgi:hypothetical protein